MNDHMEKEIRDYFKEEVMNVSTPPMPELSEKELFETESGKVIIFELRRVLETAAYTAAAVLFALLFQVTASKPTLLAQNIAVHVVEHDIGYKVTRGLESASEIWRMSMPAKASRDTTQ